MNQDILPTKLGFSLSFCIKDICEGRVKIEEVKHIISGCSPQNENDVQDILNQYTKIYWKDYPTQAREVFQTLRANHRIMWCSTFEKCPVCFGSHSWMKWKH